jgi:hypothetical protein
MTQDEVTMWEIENKNNIIGWRLIMFQNPERRLLHSQCQIKQKRSLK